MSVIRLNMREAKTHLSKHVGKLNAGDRIILCRRNRAIAEIRPIVGALPTNRVRLDWAKDSRKSQIHSSNHCRMRFWIGSRASCAEGMRDDA